MGIEYGTGGGEVLQYIGRSNGTQSRLDEQLIQQFALLPWVKGLIAVLILIAALIICMEIFSIRSFFKGKGMSNSLIHMDQMRKRDEQIQKANYFLDRLTRIVQATPFKASKITEEYMNYNISRADIRIPGGYRVMKHEEFNAIKVCIKVVMFIVGIIVAAFISVPLGLVSMVVVVYLVDVLSMGWIRSTVSAKDDEIVENFADFYLMIHYVLMAHANIPLTGIVKSYDKTTSSNEMHRFVDTCVHYFDTYGEFEGTKYISQAYREIPYVGKLMRLIRQVNEGGDVEAELRGFRQELLNAKRYSIEKRGEKMIARARASFNVLTIVLIQAVISAMLIYLGDLGMLKTFF